MKRRLTDTAVKHLKPKATQYKESDGGGLYLLVKPNGAKLWRYKYRLNGEQVFSLGSYSDGMALAAARKLHEWARDQVAQGLHPLHQRQNQKLELAAQAANTFESIALTWIEQKKANRTAYYIRQVQRAMTHDVFPKIGAMPIKSIQPAHIREIIKLVEKRGAEVVASNIRQWCSAVFKHAIAEGKAQADPTTALQHLVIRPKVRHHPSLAPTEIPAFKAALAKFGGNRVTKIAVELLMLTFVRTGELRGAEWTEFDLDNATWHIPAERMKMKQRHLVPLAAQSIALLRELETLTGGQRYLFPNQRAKNAYMSATTVNRALERMGYGGRLSGHGFRSTASTILHEQHVFRSEAIERQLAHAERSSVKAAYNHAEYLPERRKMMDYWADFIGNMPANPASEPALKHDQKESPPFAQSRGRKKFPKLDS